MLYANARGRNAYLELTSEEIMIGALVGDREVLRLKRFRQCMETKGCEWK
jgi:hypothetical protein